MEIEKYNIRLAALEERTKDFWALHNTTGATVSMMSIMPCGSCTACCKLPAIGREDLACLNLPGKPAGETCSKCTGSGCSVHQDRPTVCRYYLCLWRQGLTDNHPEASGVAWSFEADYLTGINWVILGYCGDVDAAAGILTNRQDIGRFLRTRFLGLRVSAVILRSPKSAMRITLEDGGRCMTEEAKVDQGDPLKVRLDTSKVLKGEWPSFEKV